MNMKKAYIASLALGMVALTGTASALGNTGAAWGGSGCGGEQSTTTGFRYCVASMTSGTTATQLGKQTVYPNKQIYIVAGISGTLVSGTGTNVTPTITYYLGNRVVATQNISVSTAGNIVNPGVVPYFNALSISQSVPTNISATNSVLLSIIENDK